jgi:hypothetical protein
VNAQVNPLIANILNIHAAISAECRTSALAVQSPSEVYGDDRPTCFITSEEDTTLGDDDRRYYDYNVWSDGSIVKTETNYFAAAQWANDNGYRIVSR